MLCNRISGSWQCTETVAPVGNPRGEMPSIGHPRRRVSKPHCRCAGRPNGWTWGSEERQAVAGGTRSCLDSYVKPSRRSPLGESRENHMVTQRFWSSAIYLATSNSHASGIVGPRHDHMAIIHRQAIDKQASKLTSFNSVWQLANPMATGRTWVRATTIWRTRSTRLDKQSSKPLGVLESPSSPDS